MNVHPADSESDVPAPAEPVELHGGGGRADTGRTPAAGPRHYSARADRDPTGPTAFGVLDVLADLVRGGRHTRHTISRGWRLSLPTADRWIKELLGRVPGVVRVRRGKQTCIEWAAKSVATRPARRNSSAAAEREV